MTLTITRCDFPRRVQQIIGHDVTPDEAAELVESGRAEYDDEPELPPAVYLQSEITIGGVYFPQGAMLHVGGEIDAAQCLALMRGLLAAGGEHAPVALPASGPVG
jgi:hypothetical protein